MKAIIDGVKFDDLEFTKKLDNISRDADSVKRLNDALRTAFRLLKPPEDLTVSEWANKYRVLSSDSAEPGLWRTSRTPYLAEPMNAYTDPKIRRITVVASSQVGKTEVQLNMLGYTVDQDPCSVIYIHPTVEDARKFSRQRIAPMIRECKVLRRKVADIKSRDSNNTVLQKSYPGGMLTITGSNSASALASTPARVILGDERDRWAASAGTEGDPWELAMARQITFYNAKSVEVSSPTIKGFSKIADAYLLGTQETWQHQCPNCKEWKEIEFDHIRFEHETVKVNGKKQHKIGLVEWVCPECGCLSDETVMRKQPQRWIADNPEAYERGHRSFWLSAFVSPWISWKQIVEKFLIAKEDPEKFKVFYNTILGRLWEDRGDLEDEDGLMARREDYGTRPDGSAVELPEGVLVLTCGVDTQDNRLEYEVVGHGHYGETWGIKKGFIMGTPDTPEVWAALDKVIEHEYKFSDGRGLLISLTCVDSGGHYTNDVYAACSTRLSKKVIAIKGQGGEGIPYTRPPKKQPVKDNPNMKCWLYMLGVDAGKEIIMSSLKVQQPGVKYCHFPQNEEAGYDYLYFNGLLSEKSVPMKSGKPQWVRLPGHAHNEALDCRNYAIAALRIINPDMDVEERKVKGIRDIAPVHAEAPPTKRVKVSKSRAVEEW